jgi:hypothetical protein
MKVHRLPFVAWCLALATWTASARADEKRACVTSFEDAQRLRKENKLGASREHLLRCVQETCPAVVRDYCRSWLEDVDKAQPTIVVVARDGEGRDVGDVKMTLDGRPVAGQVVGAAIAVDPGEHALRFERDASPPVEEKLVAREGEKLRQVRVTFQVPAQTAAVPEEAPKRGPSTLAIIFGGVGVVALGSFAYFGLKALSDAHHLRDTCAPYCDQADIDAVSTKNLVSGISLGVGIAALGVGTWLFLKSREREGDGEGRRPAAGIKVSPVSSGGAASFVGEF